MENQMRIWTNRQIHIKCMYTYNNIRGTKWFAMRATTTATEMKKEERKNNNNRHFYCTRVCDAHWSFFLFFTCIPNGQSARLYVYPSDGCSHNEQCLTFSQFSLFFLLMLLLLLWLLLLTLRYIISIECGLLLCVSFTVHFWLFLSYLTDFFYGIRAAVCSFQKCVWVRFFSSILRSIHIAY